MATDRDNESATTAIKSLRFDGMSAMSLDVPDVAGHPNKMPFSGIMTRLDKPSDYPPEGSGGKCVVLTKAAAEAALPSLLGMAVNVTFAMAGHDPQNKVGIITSAEIEGDGIKIEGFIYASDFPEVAAEIKKNKAKLGFSFEAADLYVEDIKSDPLTLTKLTFTGAAILLKNKAAYTTTSLAASAAGGNTETSMTKEEMAALLAEALKPINDEIATIKASQAETAKTISASKAIQDRVEPHAKALEACAAAMEADGIGAAARGGHADYLGRMAKSMRAEAALGKTPSIYRDHDYFINAGRDEAAGAATADPAVTKQVEKLEAQIAALGTKLTDAVAASADRATPPERKTLTPQITALLSRANLTVPADGEKLSVAQVDEALGKTNLDPRQRIEAKTALRNGGLLATS